MVNPRVLMIIFCLAGWSAPVAAQVSPGDCLKVTLTGTLGGPAQFDVLPGAGTLVEIGDPSVDCGGSVRLQFDVGRATVNSLGGLGVQTPEIDAIFLTHIHNDHNEGLFAFFHDLWIKSSSASVDVVCHDRIESPAGLFIDCRKLVVGLGSSPGYFKGIDGPTSDAGEIALRQLELGRSDTPSDRANMVLFTALDAPRTVWSRDGVTVSAVRSTHVPGHVSYRVDSVAGSVVIGGDAANDDLDPLTRPYSTSDQVELLAQGADVLVHSAIHPALGPGSGFPPLIFNRQSTALDLGTMAERAGVSHLMLTHLIPAIGQDSLLGVPIPPLSAEDWVNLAVAGGFTGVVHVGPPGIAVRVDAE